MIDLVPFRALLPRPGERRDLTTRLAPPAAHAPGLRGEAAALDPRNVANLTSADQVDAWVARGFLERDSAAALWVAEQEVRRGDVRRAVVGVTGAGFSTSPAVYLHTDRRGAVAAAIDAALPREPRAVAHTPAGRLRLFRAADPGSLRAVSDALRGERGFFLRGPGPLVAAVSLADAGLRLGALHHLLAPPPSIAPERLWVLLDEHFEVEELRRSPATAEAELVTGSPDRVVVALAKGEPPRRLRLRPGADLAHVAALPKNPGLRGLDAVLVRSLIVRHTLGVLDVHKRLELVPDAGALARAVEQGRGLGFLLAPAPPSRLRAVLEAGEEVPFGVGRLDPDLPDGLVLAQI